MKNWNSQSKVLELRENSAFYFHSTIQILMSLGIWIYILWEPKVALNFKISNISWNTFSDLYSRYFGLY